MARIFIGNIKGPQGERGPQGEQGPVGPQGPQGPLPPLVNNALATEAGVSALDAAMGKTLQDQITDNKDDITELNSNFELSNVQNVLFFSSSSEPFGIRIKDSTGQFEYQIVCNGSSVNFSRRVNGGEWSQYWSK